MPSSDAFPLGFSDRTPVRPWQQMHGEKSEAGDTENGCRWQDTCGKSTGWAQGSREASDAPHPAGTSLGLCPPPPGASGGLHEDGEPSGQ